MAFVVAAFRWYQLQLQHKPYLANWVTAVALMGIGDRCAQSIERMDRSPEAPDAAVAWEDTRESWTRTGVLSSWSAMSSPWWTFWYRMLARRYPGQVLRWVAMTAGLSVPFNAAFFSYATAFEHAVDATSRGVPLPSTHALYEAVSAKLRTSLLPTVATSIAVWGPVNAANFTLVPLHNRNVVASAFACSWNVFLSLQQHRGGLHGRDDVRWDLRDPAHGGGSAASDHGPRNSGADSRASPSTESG